MSTEESLKQKTFKGTIWSSIERFSVQGVQFIVMIFMARILTPSEYGIVGMISIFIAVSYTLVNSGFSQALVRKQNRTQTDLSTVFFFNIGVGLFLYFVLFFSAPAIARFYNEPLLVPITRIIAICLPLNSLGVVQFAVFTLAVDFKSISKASLSSAIANGVVGLTLAYCGYGVWALVWCQIAGTVVNVSIVWLLARWRPTWEFSWKSFRELFGFGSKLLASGLLDTLYSNIYLLVIGKVFKAADLGYYSRSTSFSSFASSNITAIFQRVSFPVLCTIQNDNARLADAYRRILKMAAYVIFPLMVGMAAVAKPMIITLVSDKWLYSAVLLVPICLAGMWYPVHAINLNLLQVKGRSDLFLRLEIIKKIVGVCILVITIPMGLYAMCWGSVVGSIIALIINTHYTGKLIHLGFIAQMRDLLPIFLMSFSVGIVVWFTMTYVPLKSWLLLIIGISEGVVLYMILSSMFRFKEYTELLGLIRRKSNG